MHTLLVAVEVYGAVSMLALTALLLMARRAPLMPDWYNQ